MPNLRKENRELRELLLTIHTDLLQRAEMNAFRPGNDDHEVIVELGNGVWCRLCDTLFGKEPEVLGLPQQPGKLPDHHIQWFNQLKLAASNGDLALMACLDAKTMQPRSVISLVSHENGQVLITPVGHMCPEDNPFEAYLPPRSEQETLQ